MDVSGLRLELQKLMDLLSGLMLDWIASSQYLLCVQHISHPILEALSFLEAQSLAPCHFPVCLIVGWKTVIRTNTAAKNNKKQLLKPTGFPCCTEFASQYWHLYRVDCLSKHTWSFRAVFINYAWRKQYYSRWTRQGAQLIPAAHD